MVAVRARGTPQSRQQPSNTRRCVHTNRPERYDRHDVLPYLVRYGVRPALPAPLSPSMSRFREGPTRPSRYPVGMIEALAGSAVAAALQRISRRRSDRLAITVIGLPPFGRLPNYFIPGVTHPSELPGSERAGCTANPYDPQYAEWVASNGGVPSGMSNFSMTVQCIGSANVALVRGRAVTDRIEPVSGIAVRHQSGGPIHGFHLNVDLGSGAIQCVPAESYPGVASPVPLEFRIEPNATEKFDIHAVAGEEPLMWHLELDFVVDGKLVTKKVLQPSGERFTTFPMGYGHAVGAFYPSTTGWIEAPS